MALVNFVNADNGKRVALNSATITYMEEASPNVTTVLFGHQIAVRISAPLREVVEKIDGAGRSNTVQR